jgi:putative FmdB family regulatory protein
MSAASETGTLCVGVPDAEDTVPTYQYACTACGHKFEAVQSFSDASLTDCPECAGRLRKVFSSVGIVFKGSGFYRTDSRSGGSEGSEGGGDKTKPGDSSPGKDGGSSTGKEAAAAKTSDSGSSSTPSTSPSSSTSTSTPAAAAS